MRKINYKGSCEYWKPGVDVEGKLLTVKECWACYYYLFGYCWLEEANAGHRLVKMALAGFNDAKQKLHAKLFPVEREKAGYGSTKMEVKT